MANRIFILLGREIMERGLVASVFYCFILAGCRHTGIPVMLSCLLILPVLTALRTED